MTNTETDPTPTISEKQLEANRRNAQSSTGPRTEEGKAQVRFNATRHGFTGQVSIMSSADGEAHEAFCARIVESLQPSGAMELQLAHAVAHDSWRLNRMTAVEDNILAVGPVSAHPLVEGDDHRIEDAARQAQVVLEHRHQFALLSLYHQRLNRSIEKNLAQLEKLQTKRHADLELELQTAALARQTAPATPETAPAAPENGFVYSSDLLERHRLRVEARNSLRNPRPTPIRAPGHPRGAETRAA
jgi:hypothetical protein